VETDEDKKADLDLLPVTLLSEFIRAHPWPDAVIILFAGNRIHSWLNRLPISCIATRSFL
jgi:hypothetical protein